jgi:hypothetical protein
MSDEMLSQIALPPFAARTDGTASRDRAALIRNIENARQLSAGRKVG